MKKIPNNKDSNLKQEKDHFSLRTLASEIYPNLSEDRAYRNTLSNFKEACKLIHIEPKEYKIGRDFKIPKYQKTAFVILIRHITIYKTGLPYNEQNYDKILTFADDLINTKNSLDDSIKDLDQNINIEDISNFNEFFYSELGSGHLLLRRYIDQLHEEIERDYRFLSTQIPSDRTTYYAEHYYKMVSSMIKDAGRFSRKMAKVILWEKRLNENE